MIPIPAILSPDEARAFRDELERRPWRDGRATAGPVAAQVKANQQLDDGDPVAARLGGLILERLGQSERFMAAALPLKVLPPRFNRYTGGGVYGGHVDGAVFSVPGTPHRVRSDLSATLFLSEPDTYEGGELAVETEVGETRVKLPAGSLLLYSARTVHRVTPVTKGVRLAAFFWIQSLVREAERREMLLELDDAIRTLEPAHPAVVRLTGLYQNLMREWAET